MFRNIRRHWVYKIMAAFIGVVLIAGVIHAAAMNLSMAAAFERHLGRMGENMQTMMGTNRGANLYSSFKAAVNDSLLISAAAAFLIAGIVAVFISRRITKPIQTLTEASHEIAQGGIRSPHSCKGYPG